MSQSSWLILLALLLTVSAAYNSTNSTSQNIVADDFHVSAPATLSEHVESYLSSLFADVATNNRTGLARATTQRNMKNMTSESKGSYSLIGIVTTA